MDVFFTAGRLILNVGIAVAVLFAISSLTLLALERLARREFFQVPLFFMVAKTLGTVLGLGFLYEQYQRHYFDLGRLFQPESPWNISVWQFLIERTNPMFYTPTGFADVVSTKGALPLLLLLGGLLALISALCIAAFRLWGPADASRGVGLTLLFALWIGYLILFGVSLLFWLLFWLNVWALLVVAMIVQHFRHRV
jgi:hypothetical protein